ncbi:MAG: hypothetical protein Q8O55_00560 [Dehalococcoidales bacterium]|nr:hypothetical protein [Dehalococcoidales bacterium]MDZ4230563.1 hypothetical protein [Dehalococcoidales bacterium]
MCQRCGCQQFLQQGSEAILKRAVDIVKELRLSPSNVDDYECTETISGMIAPFGLREDEVFQTASWVSGLHEDNPQVRRGEQYQKYVEAFHGIFARLPVQGDLKYIATTYHQLEQLARQLDESALASVGPEIKDAIEAVNHVHEDRTRQTRLKERYGL